MSEQDAKRKNLDYQVTVYDISKLDRAVADRTDVGFIKVITEKNSDKVLGATVVHSQASTMILEFVAAMKKRFWVKQNLINHSHLSFSRRS